jgi:hypothetical protein
MVISYKKLSQVGEYRVWYSMDLPREEEGGIFFDE